MNAKKAKLIRQRLRAGRIDAKDKVLLVPRSGGTAFNDPESGRSIYRQFKKLGIEEKQS